ncbi:MAG: ribokinase [Actinomycetota bacterium]|nr:ribokinase [Actinomycetota bacterium]
MGRVVVVGSVNVDLVVQVERIPRAGETVTRGRFTRAFGGKGANQAAGAARLGAETALVGMVGDDDFGREALEDLRSFGVDTSRVGVGTEPTGVAQIMVDGAGENIIAVASGANTELTGERVERALADLAPRGTIILAGLEVPDQAVRAAARHASEYGCPFILNPAPARDLTADVIGWTDVITPNELEAVSLGSVDRLLQQGARAVVVSRGAQGADLFRIGKPSVHQQPFRVEVVDTTGAGDALNAGLAWALAEGRPLEEALRLAAAAGALATRAVGARSSLATRQEIQLLASS